MTPAIGSLWQDNASPYAAGERIVRVTEIRDGLAHVETEHFFGKRTGMRSAYPVDAFRSRFSAATESARPAKDPTS